MDADGALGETSDAGESDELASGESFELGDDDEGDEEEIFDPELEGVPQVKKSVPKPPPAIRLELHSRTGVDTRWEDPREDVIESTQIAIFDATYRRSEKLRFAAGLRVRHHFARREDDSIQGRATRYELDVVPLSAYVDATLDEGVHVRGGYQILSMGRFDFFSATNFLASYDLRQGLTTMPEATEVGQPAIRTDIDVTRWLSLQSVYVPFFKPHIVTIYGTDYAMLAVLDRITPATADETVVSNFINNALDRSELAALSSAGIAALGPQPTISEPQGALRATARDAAGEVSLTVGTALERVPAFVISPEFEAFLLNPADLVTQVGLLQAERPLEVQYNRFGIVSTDGALDVGPVQLGLEAAYMVNRTFYAARRGIAPQPESTDVAHVAVRAEVVGASALASVEAFHDRALDDPREPDRRWMTLEDGRYLQGIAGVLQLTLGRFTFEVAGTATTGPTYFAAPRVEWQALDRFHLELGAFFTDGPAPGEFGQPDLAIGGIYDPTDQVFVGARWLP